MYRHKGIFNPILLEYQIGEALQSIKSNNCKEVLMTCHIKCEMVPVFYCFLEQIGGVVSHIVSLTLPRYYRQEAAMRICCR